MTKSLPHQFWSLTRPTKLRPGRVFALWATIVIHLSFLGLMLQSVVPQVLPLSQRTRPPMVPLWDDPPPPPPRPLEELVETPTPPTPVAEPVPIPPPPIEVERFVPEPVDVAVADPNPPPIANPNLSAPLLNSASTLSESGAASGAELRSGIDYHCRRPVRYPRIAERNHWEGSVRLRARIQPSGSLAAVDLAQGSGHGILDRAALSWLKRCVFSAPALDAGSVERVGEVTVHFVIQ